MPYYVRMLAEKDHNVPVRELQKRLQKQNMDALIDVESGTLDKWNQIIIKHKTGEEIALVELHAVNENSLAIEEIQEFLEEIEDAKPTFAVKWLKKYLPNVKAIYAFQILDGAYEANGWDILHEIQGEIWGEVGGIFQADGEGFSNTDGDHILWQFSDTAEGPWKMAVLNENDKWISFEMDLGNPEHRSAFMNGQLPKGVLGSPI